MTSEQRKLLVAILVPLFMSLLSISIVNVTLPSMQHSLGASDSAIQWVLSGYTLAFGIVMVAAGRAGDLLGRGQLFIAGLVLFGLGSLVSGLAPTPLVLNIARIVMGLGSGLLSPQTVGMIQQFFAGKARGVAFGAYGSVVGVSVAVGPVLGGLLVLGFGQEWGWRASFLINVPIAVIAMFVGRHWLPKGAWVGPKSVGAAPGARPKVDYDPVGTVILAAAILLIMLPFLERSWGAWIYALLVVGFAAVWIWVRWERRYARRGGAPMVDLDLFRTPSFSYGAALSGTFFLGLPCLWVINALYLQNGLGFSALASGLMGVPSAIFAAIVPLITGRIVFNYGRKMVVAGIGVALVGVAASIVVVLLHHSTGLSAWWLLLTMSFVGISQGMVISPNQTLTLAEVPVEYAGSSGGIMQTGQRIGTAIGIAIITAIYFIGLQSGGYDTAFVVAYIGIAALMVISGLVGVVDLVRGRARRKTPESVSST
ncbi:MFS transporter [Cumulibacter soli]|uniref:MFS transporter n=1 Tax=Cumulibacter soli TaxID=2546344 RepID=UPI0010683545|nr:MFS transporter [Cumulibacter soli]